MPLNYKRLGDYIQPINQRNVNLEVQTLLGVSIKKVLMPSIANTVGTDMSRYKIIKKNQFAYGPVTSRNGDKISIALLEEHDKALVSQAYTVFEIIDDEALNAEYLMMWFRRPEFDRYARFKSHGSARETFDWDELEDTELPIPCLEKQREIVAEYNTIVNRIKLNETLNKKLEDTAQALYKHWFVDFNFPITKESCPELVSGSPELEGKPYKSSGGEMVYNEELDKEIPEGWEVNKVGELFETLGGGTPSTTVKEYWENGDILWYSPTDVTGGNGIFSKTTTKKITELGLNKSSAKLIPANSLLMTSRATVGKLLINETIASTNQGFISIIPNDKFSSYYLYDWIKTQMEEILSLASGSTFLEISKSDFRNLSFTEPTDLILSNYQKRIEPLFDSIKNNISQINLLLELKDLVLAKMTKVETRTSVV
ncbi:restriction endonuclease subunit S [Winogradskyella psychrotolerans]|uniref:restriction endonuclease subunit S n=1 Tax=Winogradskyella psychrotolerans TaxID=1344585 RepID=UPI001C07B996|nr:restriction endonuclease subunit S [Winogradskyella psychrotolerans]MBU2920692.1 restriction endonuclease subunit S [Winogradskyella psychrotolerans]